MYRRILIATDGSTLSRKAVLLAARRRHKGRLIAMASPGRHGLEPILLGSETQQVLTHGTSPVLVLR